MNILVPSTPRRLMLTPSMQEDFLVDPVMGAKVIMGLTLDAFQARRLREYWWVPEVIDSSGFSSAKTIIGWVFVNLRALIIPDQKIGVYYQSFGAGKENFWTYYRVVRHPIWRAQLGKVDLDGTSEGKDNSQAPACWTQYFRNDSEVKMPAPSWGQDALTQAGLRYNVVYLDEWTKSTRVGKAGEGNQGINLQILGRVTRQSYNQHHPLWGNHVVYSATAESPSHPAWPRMATFRREIAKGNPRFAVISYNYKDYSNRRCHTGKTFKEEYRIDDRIASMRAQFTEAHFLREVLGIWARETRGWYSEEALQRCVNLGKGLGTQPMISRVE